MSPRLRRVAAEAVINVEVGVVLLFLACAGFHAWLKGRAP